MCCIWPRTSHPSSRVRSWLSTGAARPSDGNPKLIPYDRYRARPCVPSGFGPRPRFTCTRTWGEYLNERAPTLQAQSLQCCAHLPTSKSNTCTIMCRHIGRDFRQLTNKRLGYGSRGVFASCGLICNYFDRCAKRGEPCHNTGNFLGRYKEASNGGMGDCSNSKCE